MSGGESRFTKRYTDQQKEAVLKAVLIDHSSVAQAIRDAAQGKLGIPAFAMNRQYAYQVVKDGREAYEARNPALMAENTRTELQRIHAINLARSRALSDTSDPAEIARVAEALAKTLRTLPGEAKTKPSAKPSADGQNTPENPSNKPDDNTLGGLLALATKPKRPAGSATATKE